MRSGCPAFVRAARPPRGTGAIRHVNTVANNHVPDIKPRQPSEGRARGGSVCWMRARGGVSGGTGAGRDCSEMEAAGFSFAFSEPSASHHEPLLPAPALKRHPRPAERRGRDWGLQAPGLAIPAPAPCHPRRPSPRGRSCTHSTLGACRRRTRCESRSASWPRRPTSCSYSCSSARASGWPWRADSSGSSWRRSSWWVSWGLGTCVAPAGQSCSRRRTAGSGPQGQVCLQRPQAHRKGRRTALALALARILLICR